MTSFEEPDATLLVEHLLPSLLGSNHSPSPDVKERALFFGELGMALEALHGRITVISSPPRAAREDVQYPWLWRSVSHFIVGAKKRAVQHAKLWAFHWRVDKGELLELHVSSTNLTTSGFKGQLQAGWRVILLIGDQATPATRRTWGELVRFLEALGSSAGEVAEARIQRLRMLLGRVECPAGITFIASIPGKSGAGRQLSPFNPSELHVLTPTIGEWSQKTLMEWSSDVGVRPDKIHLKWISEAHPWAATSGWRLSNAASGHLESVGVQLECLPNRARFAQQHRHEDPRWSHAKLYLIRSRGRRRLLVTSANWSVAAWGAGRKSPRNFELGVVFESKWPDLEALGEPFDPPETVPFCVEPADDLERRLALEWAEARWDGHVIELRARSTDDAAPIAAFVAFLGSCGEGLALTDGFTTMAWNDPERTPLSARFKQGTEMLEVDVVDLRQPAEFARTPLPEVDPAIAQALREAFLLQRYGGAVVDSDSMAGLGDRSRIQGVGAPAANYTVQAWVEARAAFAVIDGWRTALADVATGTRLRDQVRVDGEELRALFARREGPVAALVADEFAWRLCEEA